MCCFVNFIDLEILHKLLSVIHTQQFLTSLISKHFSSCTSSVLIITANKFPILATIFKQQGHCPETEKNGNQWIV